MEIIIGWIILSIVVAVYASKKGRSGFLYFLLSILLSPLIGFAGALVVSPNTQKVEQDAISSGTQKKCPYCAEFIKAEASVCRFCGRELQPPSADEEPVNE